MLKPNFTIDDSSINAIKARVSIYEEGTLVVTCTCSDKLQKFSVSRVGESGKFFGFGICQQLKLTLIDLERELDIQKGMWFKIEYGDGTNFVSPHPYFVAEEIVKNEENGTIEITAYDKLYNASNINFADAEPHPDVLHDYNPKDPLCLMERCVRTLGLYFGVHSYGAGTTIVYDKEPDLDGTEKISDVLRMAAEALQVIYFVEGDLLYAKRINFIKEPVLTITKNDYFSLKVGPNTTLDGICHATELGDNVNIGANEGTIQYVRNNAYWEANSDNIVSYLEQAWSKVVGTSINQFTCENWNGNFLLEIGDKIAFETEDGGTIITYLLDDVITFDGTLSQTTKWAYEMSNEETPSNPVTLGETLKETYAKVDKANKQITLLASETEANKESISTLQVNVDSISASVKKVTDETKEQFGSVNDEISGIKTDVSNFKLEADNALLEFKTTVEQDGVTKVDTGTGFLFDETGLTISKTDSEITTQITEDGMTISKDGSEVLAANNQGVIAEDLHATTYLIIGNNSRLEDWGNERTACFWIGG